MKPIKFKESSGMFIGATNDIKPLPVYQNDDEIISCWKVSLKDKLKILFSGKVWLHVKGTTMPPVFINSSFPFVKEK